MNTAMVSGSIEGRTTVQRLRSDLNTVLTCFSPISKDKHLLMLGDNIDVVSEAMESYGVNGSYGCGKVSGFKEGWFTKSKK